MSSVVVGVLTIDLKANTASFSQSMDRMSALSAKTANDIKRSLEKIALAGVAMAGVVASGTALLIKGALDSADALGKAAQAAGTTVETLSMLNYAAKLSSVPTETLVKGLEKLSQSAFKAQNGNAQLSKVFARLGVATTDSSGHLEDSGVLMEQVAVKFAHMGTAGGRTALAMQLFGKGGAALIPMLIRYGLEQEKINAEAHQFGLVLTTSTVQVAAKAHDSLEKLQMVLKGVGFSVLSATLPALNDMLNKLIDIAKHADIQGLARSFGAQVATAVTILGNALGFAAKHAEALKLALVALAGLQVAKIAIPVIGDLFAGGINKVGDGVGRLVVSLLGLGKTMPVLKEFFGWSTTVASLASTEGVAATATLALGGTVAATAGIALAAVVAIGALALAIYKFRDATFSVRGTTYQLRDTWNGAWIEMHSEVDAFRGFFKGQVDDIRSRWAGLCQFLSDNHLSKFIMDDFSEANSRLDGYLASVIKRVQETNARMNNGLIPGWATRAMDQSRNTRETARVRSLSAMDITPAPLPPPSDKSVDTSGLGKETQDPKTKALADLKEKLAESQQSLAAAGMEEQAQRKVTAANLANNEINKLGQEIAKQRKITTSDYASLVDDVTKATIRSTNAQLSDNKAREELLNVIGKETRDSALTLSQSSAMVVAINEGSGAVARQTALTDAWNELRSKGGTIVQILTRSEQLYNDAMTKESVTIAQTVVGLKQQLAERQILNAAMFGTIEAQDAASLEAKLFVLNQRIMTTELGAGRDALLAQRKAIVALTEAESQQKDIQAALALRSPAKQYALEQEKLESAVVALRTMQGGNISYIETLGITAKAQENFNQMIDKTVSDLLAVGSAQDGVTAFFLDMQKQAITTGHIIYDAMKSAFDKVSENITQLITGGKTSFAKMFEDIGKTMLKQTISQQMQKGLAAVGSKNKGVGGVLGSVFGGGKAGNRYDGSSAANAMWVQLNTALPAGTGASGVPGLAANGITGIGPDANDSGGADPLIPNLSGLGAMSGGANALVSSLSKGLGPSMKSLGSIFGKLMGGGTGGGIVSSIFGSLSGLIPHAEGGSVSPGSAYLVGERGPEILTGASGNILSNAASKRTMSGSSGNTANYTIDARGTDPALTEQRTRQGILAAHNSAVVTGMQLNSERLKRVTSSAGR
jgi:hypothetical protein